MEFLLNVLFLSWTALSIQLSIAVPFKPPAQRVAGSWWSDETTWTVIGTRPSMPSSADPSRQQNQGGALLFSRRSGLFSTALRAKKGSASKKRGSSSSSSTAAGGFGGAAAGPCSCGSGVPYSKCCGRIHRSKDLAGALALARPSEVVRARYTAYARRVVDFIVASTHPANPSYAADVEHWKKKIESNCYDNFILNKCVILEELDLSDTEATVKFLARMTHRETGERTAFVETSTFERDKETRAWLYRDGVITSPEEEEDGPPDVAG
jgi:SEC-C motif-containing protein